MPPATKDVPIAVPGTHRHAARHHTTGNHHTPARIAIIGAGPVGMTLALLLARAGLAVDLFDRRHQLTRRGCRGFTIDPHSASVLATAGCAGPALRTATPWTHTHTTIGGRHISTETHHHDAEEQHLNVPQWHIERALAERIHHTPAVRLHYRSEFIRFIANTAHDVVLEIDHDGRRTTATYRFVVGCDGYDSNCRHSAGIPFSGIDHPGAVVTADLRCSPRLAPARHVRLDPLPTGHHALLDSGPNDTWRVRWHTPATTNLDADVATGRFDHHVRRLLGDHPYQVQWRSMHHYSARLADTYRRESVYLAGAAAHAVPPFGTDDLNLGLHDAANLAWKLSAILHNASPAALGHTYDTERRAAGLAALADARRVTDFLLPATSGGRLRSALTEGAGWLTRRSNGVPPFGPAPTYRYVESPLIDRGPHPLLGRVAPDAPVVADNEPGRLRDHLGPGFTVLVVDDIDPQQVPGDLTPLVVHGDWAYPRLGVGDVGAETRHRYGAMDGAVFIIRPDGYVAYVLAPAELGAWRAVLAACGGTERLLGHHFGSVYC